MSDCFINERQDDTLPIYIARSDSADFIRDILPDALQLAASGQSFNGEAGELVILRGETGAPIGALFGAGTISDDAISALQAGALPRKLPPGSYMIAVKPDDWDWPLVAIGWGLGAYKFTRYLADESELPKLVLTDLQKPEESLSIIRAINNGRDLINTPSGDMGPVALHGAAQEIAERHGAEFSVIIGDALLDQNYPMIHAVGRAAHEAPRLASMFWGDPTHPKLTLVGKGITFDTGGLNIKSAAGARNMKKDMGGAAHALTLADMIMANNLPVRLHVLVAIAENAISAGAYRPGDILPSREGLTIEIDNTDAEGRLVLGDALCFGAEHHPDMMIDFATLTGAARVALGPTLPPFFTNRPNTVEAVMKTSAEQFDPVWHMPLWQPYMKYLSSPIADMKNAGGSYAGCVTAALFLSRFVKDTPWMHFDVFGWNPAKTVFGQGGGEIFAVRALYEWVKAGGVMPREHD